MKAILPLLVACVLGTAAQADTLSLSDFSNFTPSTYWQADEGVWSESTALSGATSFTIGDFGAGAPTAANGNAFIQWLGDTPQNWAGLSYVNLTGVASASNAATSIDFYIEDSDGVFGLTTFDLSSFGSLSTISRQIDFGAVNSSAISFWGFRTNSFDSPAPNFGFTFDRVSVSTSAIPEPSTYAALLGGAALTLVLCRRYRSKKP